MMGSPANLSQFADQNDTRTITNHVKGGLNGVPDVVSEFIKSSLVPTVLATFDAL